MYIAHLQSGNAVIRTTEDEARAYLAEHGGGGTLIDITSGSGTGIVKR